METDFEIRFGKSSSMNYQTAIDIAKKFDNFSPIETNSKFNIIKTNSKEILNKHISFEHLSSIISSWKSTEITYKGQEIDSFYEFNKVLRCSKGYENATNKDRWCSLNFEFSGWGCQFLTNIQKHIKSESYYQREKYWYKFGSFESEKIWKINKDELKELLKKEAEDKKLFHCPFFSIDKVFNSVNELPDLIDLNDNNNWEIEYKDDFYGTSIQKKPVSINHLIEEEQDNDSSNIFSFSNLLKDISKNDRNENNDSNERKRFIPNITFEDIGGVETIIDQIREVIELPLKHPEIYQHLGIKPHKGILLYGDPGNGKTLIAKAIANEVKAHFIPISGPELISKWHGESEENLRKIFKEARDLQPSIIFFDEIDSVAQKRSDDVNARLDAKFVNQLLTLMDGMEGYEHVTILASTNRPELLDDALLRPGRFDYKIEIQRPDESGCYKIIKVATKKMPLDVSLDIKKISSLLVGFSGAEIIFTVKEAAINSLKRSINIIDVINNDLEKVDLSGIIVKHEDFIIAIEKLKSNTLNN